MNCYDHIHDNWEIRYSAFIDELVLFDADNINISREQIEGEMIYGVKFAFDRRDGKLLMMKIDNASSTLGVNINELTKYDIIKKVKEYLYERTKKAAYYQQYSSFNVG